MLQAETIEDLQEWKTALENALAQAPNHPTGQNGIFRNDQNDSVDGSLDQCMLFFVGCFTHNVKTASVFLASKLAS